MLAQTFRKDKTGQFYSLPGMRTGDLSPGARLQRGKSRLSCQQLRTQTQVSKGSACADWGLEGQAQPALTQQRNHNVRLLEQSRTKPR